MNRPDPYGARALELCIAAGQEPDARVGPGRGWPAWTEYRQKARAEHLAREAEAAAHTIAPQGLRYADAPLIVIGNHEPSTLDQMRNCMKVGNVVGGVICADGHLGYAQPVGGVIAYEDQISISGVGFDIGCGNMAIKLDVKYDHIAGGAKWLACEIARVISFGVGRVNDERLV